METQRNLGLLSFEYRFANISVCVMTGNSWVAIRRELTMNENEITNEFEEQDETSLEEIEVASWVPTLLVGGTGMIIGVVVHKFVVPAFKKVASSAKEKLIEVLTKNENESIEIEAQVEEEDSKN